MLIRHGSPLIVEAGTHDAWELVKRSQLEPARAGWMVPQPAHSALSGDIAAHLKPQHFPGIDTAIIRAIALHDAGWGQADAQQVQGLRANAAFVPASFVSAKPATFLHAWKASIDVAEKISAAAGYMVSRHFDSIGKEQGSAIAAAEQKQIDAFHQSEIARQQCLVASSGKSVTELEALLQANRFCDLLSLFLCSNIELAPTTTVHFAANVDHPDGYELSATTDGFRFGDDSPLREPCMLSFSGLGFGNDGDKHGNGWFTVALS